MYDGRIFSSQQVYRYRLPKGVSSKCVLDVVSTMSCLAILSTAITFIATN